MKYIYEGDKFQTMSKDGRLLRVSIQNDLDCENPRIWDTVAHLYCWNKRYDLGDKHEYDLPEDLFADLLEFVGYTEVEIRRLINFDISFNERMYNVLEALNKKDIVIKPLYLYDHSGITISVNDFRDPFDSGLTGFAFVSKEEWLKNTGSTDEEHWRDLATQNLLDEVNLYDTYLKGEVYSYSLSSVSICACCGQEVEESIDSCGGFYGSEIHENGMLEYLPEEFVEMFKEEN